MVTNGGWDTDEKESIVQRLQFPNPSFEILSLREPRLYQIPSTSSYSRLQSIHMVVSMGWHWEQGRVIPLASSESLTRSQGYGRYNLLLITRWHREKIREPSESKVRPLPPYPLALIAPCQQLIRRNQEMSSKRKRKKERCSGSYCQAVGFLVIKDDSISERPG